MNVKKIRDGFYESVSIKAVKQGLMFAIPFIILGSFALLFKSFPIEAYQNALNSICEGSINTILTIIYNCSLGSIALILIFTISLSYGKMINKDEAFFYPVTAIVSYLVFCGGLQNEIYIFQSEWVFTAMCITLIVCSLLKKGLQMASHLERLHTAGANYIFNKAMQSIFPIVVIVFIFAVAGESIRFLTGETNIVNFGSYIFIYIFDMLGSGLIGTLLYVFFVHFLWFFGVHGTNALDMVSKQLFEPSIEINKALINQGQLPTELFSKTFLDTFVFIGGCGAALCLVLALFIVAKKGNNKKLAKVASFTVFFNINELVIFGLPVIFNPIMLIPFVLTPLILTLISSFAIQIGLVPYIINSVEWIVPIGLSGYQATGSFAGSVLQIVNLIIGTLIYIPFVRYNEQRQSKAFEMSIKAIEADMFDGENNGNIPLFLSEQYVYHFQAKTLAMDLYNAMHLDQLELYYQAQMTYDNHIYGAEALLRWYHPVIGFISPPLMISLADQSGYLDELGLYIIEKACKDAVRIDKQNLNINLSINISPRQLENKQFVANTLEIINRYPVQHVQIVFEVTERVLLITNNVIIERILELRDHGIKLSMDDFGMGHSSMTYLQKNIFDEVKLDGTLVSQLQENERTKEIIASITQMAERLHFNVVAEYVESKEQMEILKAIGCYIYQGYYFAKPQPIDIYLQFINTVIEKETLS